MATTLATLEIYARRHLTEETASFWSSAELIDLAVLALHDLWRAINDLRLEHFSTVDASNVSQAASTTTLTGVPADVARVVLIEPRDLTSTATTRHLQYRPLPYGDPKFAAARADSDQDPASGVIWYALHGAGGPVAAPTIYVAPTLTSAVNLRLVYVPTIGTLTSASTNPVPGESDHAVVAWVVAHARAKERGDRAPDPNWLAIYSTEKDNLLNSLAPRQTQEPRFAGAMFEAYW